MPVAQVAFELALHKLLTYSIPSHLQLDEGSHVLAPIGSTLHRGVVVAIHPTAPPHITLKPIHSLLSGSPVLTPDLFALAHFMSTYYATPLNRVITTMLPAPVRHNSGTPKKSPLVVTREATREEIRTLIPTLHSRAPHQAALLEAMLPIERHILLTELLEQVKAPQSALKALQKKKLLATKPLPDGEGLLASSDYFLTRPKTLLPDQQQAFDAITASIRSGSFQTHLLFGITGSGKTEVYLQAIDAALQQGRNVIMMVPEIALTHQTIERFRSRFSDKLAVLHSQLTASQRNSTWQELLQGSYRIAIGARSAIFSPLANVGLIIVDEEHESSYKSASPPCYNARDLAVWRAKQSNATCILGSATPSLESYQHALTGKYQLNTLTARASGSTLPQVTVIDMKPEYAKGATIFSDTLLSQISACAARKEQTILFLNRRGYNTQLVCDACKEMVLCPSCDRALTYHKAVHHLHCHLCGHQQLPPVACPACQAPDLLKYRGIGTERVETMLHAMLPHIRSLRVDRDTTRHKGSLEELLQQFRTGKADVLIGTQMIAKGLHFPEVTLVGILNCDASLRMPDYRAQETTFQLITQVAGRAGRGSTPGTVIIQTQLPNHPVIQYGKAQNFEAFFNEEIAIRRTFGYPPFCHMIKLTFSSEHAGRTEEAARAFHTALATRLDGGDLCHEVTEGSYAKVQGLYRFEFQIRTPRPMRMAQQLQQLLAEQPLPSHTSVAIDVDPL